MQHRTDLVSNAEQAGAQWLYLGAHRWSVYRTLLSASFPNNPVGAFVNGEASLQITQAVDKNANSLISQERFSLDALNPYAELVVANQLEDTIITLVPILKLQPVGILNVTYDVPLTYGNNSGEHTARGEFQLPLWNMKVMNAFVLFNGGLANVNFTTSS